MSPHLFWLVLVAQAVHVGLEEAPRFVGWARGYNPDFDRKKFILGNAVIGGWMLVCIALAAFHPAPWTAVLGFSMAAYIFFNFLYHGYATLASGAYSPGVVTGGAINVPVFLFLFWKGMETGALTPAGAVAALVLGFLPMVLILKSIGLKPASTQKDGES